MEKKVVAERSMLTRFFSQAIHDNARLFICGEKSFNTEVLQGNIQRGAQGSQRRKKTKRRVLPLVIDRQKGWRHAVQIEHAPTAWHARIAEQMFEETLQPFVRGVVCSFAM